MKAIKYFAFMMLAMTFALGFSACSDDDDKDKDYILTFNSNHTGSIEY